MYFTNSLNLNIIAKTYIFLLLALATLSVLANDSRIIATEVDTAANMLTPKIGWMVVKSENTALYIIKKKYWPLYLCLTVLVISILGLIVWIVRKIIKSRRKSK